MAFELYLTCIKIKWYTKFQINMSKHVGEKCGKLWRTDGRTDGWMDGDPDGRTDGRTDGHHHTIIRPVWRRAYKNYCMMWKVLSQGIHMWNMKVLSLVVHKLWPRLKFLKSRSNFKVKNYCMMWKVLSQGIHMWNMQVLSLVVHKLWPRLKFSSMDDAGAMTIVLRTFVKAN